MRRGVGQYDAGSLASALATAIQQMEGWIPPGSPGYPQGSLSYRNNNPGNLRPGSLAVGATGSNGGYAVFPNYQTGYNALVGLVQSPAYWNLTLNQFFAQYAPASDSNNPSEYAATVAAQLGVYPDTPLSTLAAGGGPSDSGDGSADTGASGDSADGSDFGSTLADAFSSVSPVVWATAGALLLAAVVL